MAFTPQRFDRLEMEMLKYHAPKASVGMGGAMTMEVKTVMLPEIVRDLDLKGREAMIQRAYSKFCTAGLMQRSGYGYKLTDKGVEVVNEIKKFSM
jgi:hypothetical protein